MILLVSKEIFYIVTIEEYIQEVLSLEVSKHSSLNYLLEIAITVLPMLLNFYWWEDPFGHTKKIFDRDIRKIF